MVVYKRYIGWYRCRYVPLQSILTSTYVCQFQDRSINRNNVIFCEIFCECTASILRHYSLFAYRLPALLTSYTFWVLLTNTSWLYTSLPLLITYLHRKFVLFFFAFKLCGLYYYAQPTNERSEGPSLSSDCEVCPRQDGGGSASSYSNHRLRTSDSSHLRPNWVSPGRSLADRQCCRLCREREREREHPKTHS